MNDYIPFLIFGIVSGSVYGLSAMGLVLTYKTSGIFNFGQGGVTAVAAYLYYELHERGWPPEVAVPAVVLGYGVVAGLLMERISVLLLRVPTANRVVGTIGLLMICQAGIVAIYTSAPRAFPGFLPTGNFEIADTVVRYDQVVTAAVALVAAVGMFIFFRVTRIGTEMRAVVDDPDLLDISGTAPVRVRQSAWIIGSIFAAASGLLIAPATNLEPILLPLLVVQAFGAAALGRFTSLPLAYAGGLLIGILTSVIPKWTTDTPSLQGLPLAVPFLVLIVALLATPRRKLREVGRPALVAPRPASARNVHANRAAGVLALIGAILIPHLVGAKLGIWTSALPAVILFLSLNLLVRLSGQVSLCHIAFQAIGAATFTHLTDLPWLAAVLLSAAAAVPLGLLAAIPAMRLPTLYLATTTLGLAILVQYLLYDRTWFFGHGTGREAPRPQAFGLDGDKGYYYLLLAFVVATVALILAVEKSRLGRLLRGMSDSPVAMTTLGTGVNVLRVLVFCLSAFIAGLSGALIGPLVGVVDQTRFNFLYSLIVLTVLVISGRWSVASPVIAAALLVVLPGYVQNQWFLEYQPVFFGFGALLLAMAPAVQVNLGGPANGRPRREPDSARRALSARLAAPEPDSSGLPELERV